MSDTLFHTHLIQVAVSIVIFSYLRFRLNLSVLFSLALTSLYLPVFVLVVTGRYLFASDFLALAPVFAVAIHWNEYVLKNRKLLPVFLLMTSTLVVWPVLSTGLSVWYLGEDFIAGNLVLHIYRSICYTAFFVFFYNEVSDPALPAKAVKLFIAAWTLYAVFGVLQLLGALDTDAFWIIRREALDPADKYDAVSFGFLGMDKPQIALWALYGGIFSVCFFLHKKGWKSVCYLFPLLLSLIIILIINSRTAFAAMFLGMIVLFLLNYRKIAKTALLSSATILSLFLLVSFAGGYFWELLGPERQAVYLARNLALVEAKDFEGLLAARDETIVPLLKYIADDEHRLSLGSGVSTDRSDLTREVSRTYAEGELFRVLWAGGIVSLAGYVALLCLLGRVRFSNWRGKTELHRINGEMLFLMIVVGAISAFSQYHLFTTTQYNIPILYLVWSYMGMLWRGGHADGA